MTGTDYNESVGALDCTNYINTFVLTVRNYLTEKMRVYTNRSLLAYKSFQAHIVIIFNVVMCKRYNFMTQVQSFAF